MNSSLLPCLIFLAACSTAVAQFTTIGGASRDAATAMTTDPKGNVYVATTFQGTVDFDPSAGEMIRFSAGDTTDPASVDIAVIKYSADLVPQWVITIGSPGVDHAHAVRIAPNGDVVIVGSIGGVVYDIDPSDTVTSIFGNAGRDCFVARYTADGRVRWARSFGDTDADTTDASLYDEAFDCDIDADGNVYVVGGFNGVMSMNDSPDTTGSILRSTKDSKDIWFAKYNADGVFQWAHSIGGVGRDEGHGIRAYQGGMVITGSFSNALDCDLSNTVREVTSNGGTDVFTVRYAADGSVLWLTSFGGADYDDNATSMAMSTDGEITITGEFGGTVDVDRGPTLTKLVSKGAGDVFLVRYDRDSVIRSAFNVGGAGTDRGRCVVVDGTGTVFVTGSFETVADFDPTSGVLSLQAGGTNGADNAFVASYSRDGAVRWATAFGAPLAGEMYTTQGAGLALDDINGVWASGVYFDAIDIDPGATQFFLRSHGASDGFITHYEPKGGLNLGSMTTVTDDPDRASVLRDVMRGERPYRLFTVDGRTIDATLQQAERGIYLLQVLDGTAATIPVMIR